MLRVRLTTLLAGVLLGGLVLGDLGAVAPSPVETRGADLRLVRGGCDGFTAKQVLRGKSPRNPARCRPVGLDGGVVRNPIAKAGRRDRNNFKDRAHGKRRHKGTDYRTRCGTKVRAAHGGKVVNLERGRKRSVIAVTTGPQRLTTSYGPLKRVRVKQGAVIKSGRTLGRVTRDKRGKRCSLHFAVRLRFGARNPEAVNPSVWLKRHWGRHVSGMPPGKRKRGSFIVATFNVLGHSHTARGGKKRRQFASSGRRMNRSIGLLESNRVSLVGLQEFQRPQRRMFLRRTKGWGLHSPRSDPQDSIAWRTNRFKLLRKDSIDVPYFKSNRPMPVVTLRDRATGRKLSVISVHNPANRGTKRKMAKRRHIAVGRELRAVERLKRTTGAPVILMGDFNDNGRRFYCRVVNRGMHASSRGTRGKQCRPSRGNGIDWIFATKKIRFRGHMALRGGVVARTTDHPLVLARVRR